MDEKAGEEAVNDRQCATCAGTMRPTHHEGACRRSRASHTYSLLGSAADHRIAVISVHHEGRVWCYTHGSGVFRAPFGDGSVFAMIREALSSCLL